MQRFPGELIGTRTGNRGVCTLLPEYSRSIGSLVAIYTCQCHSQCAATSTVTALSSESPRASESMRQHTHARQVRYLSAQRRRVTGRSESG